MSTTIDQVLQSDVFKNAVNTFTAQYESDDNKGGKAIDIAGIMKYHETHPGFPLEGFTAALANADIQKETDLNVRLKMAIEKGYIKIETDAQGNITKEGLAKLDIFSDLQINSILIDAATKPTAEQLKAQKEKTRLDELMNMTPAERVNYQAALGVRQQELAYEAEKKKAAQEEKKKEETTGLAGVWEQVKSGNIMGAVIGFFTLGAEEMDKAIAFITSKLSGVLAFFGFGDKGSAVAGAANSALDAVAKILPGQGSVEPSKLDLDNLMLKNAATPPGTNPTLLQVIKNQSQGIT